MNRHTERQALDHAWKAREGPCWVALEGPPGIGKTTLAAMWAHQVDAWPGGALYTDLAHTRPEQSIATWLRALGLESPPTADGARALWRTVTHHRQLLAIIDNATPDQARHLLPAGEDCAGIAIGHAHMAALVADGARYLPLSPLSGQEVRELITGLLPAQPTPKGLGEAVRSAAGSPLSATLAAAYLARHPSSHQVPKETRVTDHVHHVLNSLPRAESEAARLLAAHPGPRLSPDLASVILRRPRDQAHEVLDRLVESALITDAGRGRYTLHPQIRQAAVSDLPLDRHRTVLGAIARYFRLRLAAADQVLNPWRWRLDLEGARLAESAQEEEGDRWFSCHQEALAWGDEQIDNVLDLARALATHGLHQDLWVLGDHVVTYVIHRQPWAAARELYPLCLSAAEACAHTAATGLMHQRVAAVSIDEPERRAHHARAALDAYTRAGHREGRSSAHQVLGDVATEAGELGEAVRHYAISERLHLELGRARGAALTARKNAVVLTRLGRPVQALAGLGRARTALLAQEPPDVYQATRCLQAVVEARLALGDVPGAEQAALTALEEAAATGSPRQQGSVHVALADIERARGDHRRETVHLDRALELYEHIGHPDAEQVRKRTSP